MKTLSGLDCIKWRYGSMRGDGCGCSEYRGAAPEVGSTHAKSRGLGFRVRGPVCRQKTAELQQVRVEIASAKAVCQAKQRVCDNIDAENIRRWDAIEAAHTEAFLSAEAAEAPLSPEPMDEWTHPSASLVLLRRPRLRLRPSLLSCTTASPPRQTLANSLLCWWSGKFPDMPFEQLTFVCQVREARRAVDMVPSSYTRGQ